MLNNLILGLIIVAVLALFILGLIKIKNALFGKCQCSSSKGCCCNKSKNGLDGKN